jgi:exo-beta-1,3-glucanase (GH17 family)
MGHNISRRGFMGTASLAALLATGLFSSEGSGGEGEEERSFAPPDIDTTLLTTSKKIFGGLCYSPFRDGEAPGAAYPSEREIRQDVRLLRKLTSFVRVYETENNLDFIPDYCKRAGINCLVGSWLSADDAANQASLERIVAAAKKGNPAVKALIVGNETISNGFLSEEQLINYIWQTRLDAYYTNKSRAIHTISTYDDTKTYLPVSTAEPWAIWHECPLLAEAVNFITAHIHPYWDKVPIENAVDYVINTYRQLQSKYPNKTVIIGETGWPSAGEQREAAIPSEENQKRFLSEFIPRAKAEAIPYFIFEAFDEKWKANEPNGVGPHWGLINSDGSVKSSVYALLPRNVRRGFKRI